MERIEGPNAKRGAEAMGETDICFPQTIRKFDFNPNPCDTILFKLLPSRLCFTRGDSPSVGVSVERVGNFRPIEGSNPNRGVR